MKEQLENSFDNYLNNYDKRTKAISYRKIWTS
jgi:hypothetical protein